MDHLNFLFLCYPMIYLISNLDKIQFLTAYAKFSCFLINELQLNRRQIIQVSYSTHLGTSRWEPTCSPWRAWWRPFKNLFADANWARSMWTCVRCWSSICWFLETTLRFQVSNPWSSTSMWARMEYYFHSLCELWNSRRSLWCVQSWELSCRCVISCSAGNKALTFPYLLWKIYSLLSLDLPGLNSAWDS